MASWKQPTTLAEHIAEALPLVLILLAMVAWMFVPDRVPKGPPDTSGVGVRP